MPIWQPVCSWRHGPQLSSRLIGFFDGMEIRRRRRRPFSPSSIRGPSARKQRWRVRHTPESSYGGPTICSVFLVSISGNRWIDPQHGGRTRHDLHTSGARSGLRMHHAIGNLRMRSMGFVQRVRRIELTGNFPRVVHLDELKRFPSIAAMF